ncbi:hypothetical protein [Polaromonas sp. JS666]|uniref:hypothetical protein n=1 Tax=Polaromonas sp. (strain JS666 / ATCC BAA-500) TaxID=296591 RepID=UPI000884AC22|nr:hypothetical protein [Polaromonas sp. JS666]SDN72030.1 hypothetical protein SAMN05720382_10734 [Polaromonas sp. JS666]
MPTPALRPFLDATGRIVHHLNTIVVGLSAVEGGTAVKPATMDITWAPHDPRTSSRQARAFALRSTLVFLSEEVNIYLDRHTTFPGVKRPADWESKSKTDRLLAVWRHWKLDEDFILAGALLVGHWRNRNVHRKSNARLTDAQRKLFVDAAEEIGEKFKNLDPRQTLEHFEKDTPTLKDVSSLTAMTIRCVKRLDEAVPEPKSADEVNEWFSALGLAGDLDRVRRVSAAKGTEAVGVSTFLRTHCPELLDAYAYYCADAV